MPDDSLMNVAQIADPTARTMATLHREIETVRDELEASLKAEWRITTEKFLSVEREFTLLERGRVEQKSDTKTAVDAALAAQKDQVKEQTLASEKSIAKSEAATTKQIEQQGVSYNQGIASLTNSLQDLKDRVIKIESIKQGAVEQVATAQTAHADARGNVNTVVAVAAVIGPMVTIIAMRAFGL